MARESFSLLHFPMMLGVIFHAYAVEEAVAHPNEPFTFTVRLALALGVTLFVGGTGAALWRATGRLPWSRTLFTLATAVIVLVVTKTLPAITLTLVFSGVVLVAAAEQRPSLRSRDEGVNAPE